MRHILVIISLKELNLYKKLLKCDDGQKIKTHFMDHPNGLPKNGLSLKVIYSKLYTVMPCLFSCSPSSSCRFKDGAY